MSHIGKKTYSLTLCALFAAIIAVCSWVTIPAGVVTSFTLQTFGVFLAVGCLGGKLGTVSVVIYVLLGALGVPVFAGMRGGIGALLGNDGGYITGFIFAALTMWLILKLSGKKTIIALVLSMAAGLVVCYAFGTAWFMIAYARSTGAVGLGTVLGWCVLPFIIPDAVKIALAAVISDRVRKYVKLPD